MSNGQGSNPSTKYKTGQGEGGSHTNMEEGKAANFKKWYDFMETMLGSLDNENVEACSISLVPYHLRKSKAEAYMPHVVSIGPLHKGKITDLLYMEEVKWRCMLHFLSRYQDPKEVLRNCGRTMLDLDEIVRVSYNVDEVKFDRDNLAKIMVVDGCFLLELLISGTNLSGPSPGAEVIQREKVLSDLTMLENQIPLFVLRKLFQKLFPQTDEDNTKLINEYALSILGYDYSSLNSSCSDLKAFHLLELVHSFIDKEKVKDNTESGKAESVTHRNVKLQRCATRLCAAGVRIENNARTAKIRFDLRVRFSHGKLKIPQLHVTEMTEAKWRNFIAWELNRTTLEKQRGRKEARISCQFISYAWFIQGLICCVHDVKLLQDRNVISVDEVESEKGKKKIMSNEDLMNLFRNITEGVPESEIDMDPLFNEMIQELNAYPTVDHSITTTCRIIINCVKERSIIMLHILRCFVTWIWYKSRVSYRVLRRDYIPTGWGLIAVLAAATGLALTAIQTHYSIHS